MRVIAGEAKGRKLKMVRGSSTRPVGERVKEALFGILGDLVVEARFLDLFAGTGSVGIEALSRGADFALFVEQQRQAVLTIRDNLAHTGLKDRAQVSIWSPPLTWPFSPSPSQPPKNWFSTPR